MVRTLRRCLLLVALASGVAVAQPATTPGNTPVQTPAKQEGDYGGVDPDAPKDDKTGKRKRRAPKGTLTWIGFAAKDGGAELFFQSVAPFEVTQRMEGSTLVIHLSLTRLGPNTWRPIDTRYFDNPLARVVARTVGARRATKQTPARKRGIDVRVTFKNPKDAREGSVRAATEGDGMHYVYVTFPEGTAEPGASSAGGTVQEPEK